MFLDESRHNLAGGLHQAVFEDYILQLLNAWGIMDIYKMRAMEAIEFQYTYWADPSNNTARVLQFIDVSSSHLRSVTYVKSAIMCEVCLHGQPLKQKIKRKMSMHSAINDINGLRCSPKSNYKFDEELFCNTLKNRGFPYWHALHTGEFLM